MRKVWVAMLIVFSQAGCLFKAKEKTLGGLWFFTHSSEAVLGDDMEANPTSFLYLRPDNTYTRDFKKFEYGHWKRNDSVLFLTNDQKITTSFLIRQISSIEIMLKNKEGLILNFEKQPAKFASPADNPFSIENNQWRIRAPKKEGEREIRDRLGNHFRFYESYFKWALAANLSSIDVRSTPSPIKIYGNGFSLKNFNELPETWRTYFFDDEDCRKANDMVKNIFEKENIAWAQTDNKYKMFISAFQQLQQKIHN